MHYPVISFLPTTACLISYSRVPLPNNKGDTSPKKYGEFQLYVFCNHKFILDGSFNGTHNYLDSFSCSDQSESQKPRQHQAPWKSLSYCIFYSGCFWSTTTHEWRYICRPLSNLIFKNNPDDYSMFLYQLLIQ
ncbi:unnamed protein product [Schistosoma mattheei]|uniref:Uncharacterized protein n=1 Tax=Schistosoma mattheei TaxID=31246 RepID=A0AA85BVA4_9TREM|nr:unnamed protein product [Schistosoma mattheei]